MLNTIQSVFLSETHVFVSIYRLIQKIGVFQCRKRIFAQRENVIYVHHVFFISLNIQNLDILLFNNDLKRHYFVIDFCYMILSNSLSEKSRAPEGEEEVSVESARNEKMCVQITLGEGGEFA